MNDSASDAASVTDPGEALPSDDGLDASQRAAVRSPATALLVVAGPGSGKTRVLTHRIAWRAATESMQARRAVAVTFTRRAAHELRTRLRELDIDDMGPVGTFHSIALAQVRQYDFDHDRAERKILPSRFALGSQLSEHLQRSFGPKPPITVATALREIDWAKASDLSVVEYREGPARHRLGPTAGEAASELFDYFERFKSENRLLDFDDLLAECTRLMRADEHFASARRWLHRHFFVDEFQDLNRLQWDLLQEWIGGPEAVHNEVADICAVGDIDQAIYGWNGADTRYIAEFDRYFDGAQVIQLELNYRSHPSLVAAAQAVLADDDRPHPANPPVTRTDAQGSEDTADTTGSSFSGRRNRRASVTSDDGPSAADRSVQASVSSFRQQPARLHETGPAPSVTEFDDAEAEAAGIARWITDHRVGGVRWDSFGVLARTNNQLNDIGAALGARGVPHRLSGQRSPFLQMPAVRRLLEHMGGSGPRFVSLVEDMRAEARAGMAHNLRETAAERPCGTSPRPSARERSGSDSHTASDALSNEPSVAVLLPVLDLAEAYLAEVSSAAGRTSLRVGATGEGFANWVTLLARRDRELTDDLFRFDRLGASLDPRDGAVTLATFHAAKGLQWPYVVVAGVEDGLVPLRRNDLEERRLFYVAVSRASRALHLTWARRRAGRGAEGETRGPSPWLERIVAVTTEPPPLSPNDAVSQVAAARAALEAAQQS